MRIVSGEFKGRRFHPPADKWPTRPTTDFAREALFNILENRLDWPEVRMLDLFGGTGSHSIEAISRGCTSVTYVDKHRPCVRFVAGLVQQLAIEQKIRMVCQDVARFLEQTAEPYDYVFAGPPYPLPWLAEVPDMVCHRGWLAAGGLLVLEHNDHYDFGRHDYFEGLRKYGGTRLSFFTGYQAIVE